MPLPSTALLQRPTTAAQSQADPPQRRTLQQQPDRHAVGRRRLLSLSAPLLFLPWRGCDQGGNYSTGVPGEHGDNCQQIYQPAAAAEKRFAERQRQAAAEPAQSAPVATQTPREERATLLKEQAAFERAAMQAEQAQRTRQLVDSAWQSLE